LKRAGLRAEAYLAIGKTAVEIIRMSREYNATMIVMGRTGKDWFQEYWLGGVSHRVAENSELPVLLVP
jgi:nucleotide-binding universal stress UspA family protein